MVAFSAKPKKFLFGHAINLKAPIPGIQLKAWVHPLGAGKNRAVNVGNDEANHVSLFFGDR